jgi:hypothetical protein
MSREGGPERRWIVCAQPTLVLALAAVLTGCGRGELWGLFPGAGSLPAQDGGVGDASTCAAGVACIPTNRCNLGQTTCVGGVLACQDLGQPDWSAEGQSCLPQGTCQGGICQVCTAGSACVPGNVCHVGSTVCSAGQASCQDTGAPNPAANGNSCGPGQVCDQGACASCSSGSTCHVDCQVGSVSCTSGKPVCGGLQLDPGSDGRPCGDGGTCQSGACVAPPAGHPVFPQIPDQGGSILTAPQLVTVTFPNYPYQPEVEAFGNWVMSSSWMSAVGADYGVGLGTAAGTVHLGQDAPASATQQEVENMLGQAISDGTAPSPTSLAGEGIYMIYFPKGTQLSTFFGQSCSAFQGYHNYFTFQGVNVVYAVIADCGGSAPLQPIEEIASHEMIEACSDPHPRGSGPPTAYAIADIRSAWGDSLGGEVGDLCASIETTDPIAGFFAQRIWSNSAAAKGDRSPCVPAPSKPFFTVSAQPADTQQVAAGSSLTFMLTGWSSAPAGSWNISVVRSGAFDSTPQLGASMIGNGGTTGLTLTVPTGAASGSIGWAAVQSFDGSGQVVSIWPVAVMVP